jgi:hypothetical protein
MLQGKLPYGSWHDHVSSWLLNDRENIVLAVSYEKLVENTELVLKEIITHLNLTRNSKQIESAISNSTIQKQRKDFFKYKQETHWSKDFRGGVSAGPGKWRVVFDDDSNELFWRYAGKVASRLGYIKNR